MVACGAAADDEVEIQEAMSGGVCRGVTRSRLHKRPWISLIPADREVKTKGKGSIQ
jgi:hypothetical protein